MSASSAETRANPESESEPEAKAAPDPDPDRHVLPHVRAMRGYVPGEQPREAGFVKLNTNENPHPPSPRALDAIRAAVGDRLRLYPDPAATAFRRTAARVLGRGLDPSMFLVGNGSDDLLTILTRTFAGPGDLVAAPAPTYILYRTLAQIQNARFAEIPFRPDWSLDLDALVALRPRLVFLANPNSPSGTALPPETVAELARALDAPLVVDEAYADFAETDCLHLVTRHPNVIVTRTLSKGYGLAGLRFGYLAAHPAIVEQLAKVKDSYNCDALALAGAAAALEDVEHLATTRSKILAARARLARAMREEFGCEVPESAANFVWCVGGVASAETYEALKARRILVRLMRYPGLPDGLRITVGADPEIDALLGALREIDAEQRTRTDRTAPR